MSLMETCLAIAVISTTVAVSSPSLIRAREVYVLNAEARGVASKMYAARIEAIAQNRDCRLNVTSATSYQLECQETAAWQPVESVVLRKGITITANARPEFHRRGNVSPTGTISVWDSRGRMVQVVVNVNGRIRLQ